MACFLQKRDQSFTFQNRSTANLILDNTFLYLKYADYICPSWEPFTFNINFTLNCISEYNQNESFRFKGLTRDYKYVICKLGCQLYKCINVYSPHIRDMAPCTFVWSHNRASSSSFVCVVCVSRVAIRIRVQRSKFSRQNFKPCIAK